MRHQNLTGFALIACASFLFACTKNSHSKVQTSDTPNLTNGLVLYLPINNGSFADSSGLNNAVTAVDGATLGYDMHGYAQSAYNGTGNGSYLMVANNGSYAVDTAFALSFDFMSRVSTGTYSCCGQYNGLPVFISIVDVANGDGATFNCGFTEPGAPQYFCFSMNSSTSSCDNTLPNPKNITDTSYNFALQAGSWYNAILEFSHGTLSTYINGRLMSQKTGGTDSVLFCPNANFVVGGWWGGVQNFNGELDEIRFYNHTLNAQQIAWLSRNFQINSTSEHPGLRGRTSPAVN